MLNGFIDISTLVENNLLKSKTLFYLFPGWILKLSQVIIKNECRIYSDRFCSLVKIIYLIDDCWDVRQCFVPQFKTDYVRLIVGLVFEKKKIFFGDR